MPACRDKPLGAASCRRTPVRSVGCLAGLIVAALLANAAGGAAPVRLAEVGQPVVLTPTAPSDGAAPAAAPESPDDTERAPSGIEVNRLEAIGTDYGGLLEASQGGFGIDMWRGTERSRVEQLLPLLPAPIVSPALRDLARRLLLSAAAAPAGPADGRNLTIIRADRLTALGSVAEAGELLRQVPDRDLDAAAARLQVETLLLTGDADKACAKASELIRRFGQDVYLQKALIFCQAKAGQAKAASLGLDLLREQGQDDDKAFRVLAEALIGGSAAKLKSYSIADGLRLAMLRAAGTPLAADALKDSPPAVLAAVAGDAKAGPTIRLATAERAASAGAMPIETLIGLYAAEEVQADELDKALQAPDSGFTAHRRAILYQATARATHPAARAQLLQRSYALARAQGGYGSTVSVSLPLLLQLAPQPEIAWFCEDAAGALYFSGRYAPAADWGALAHSSTDPKAVAGRTELAVLARLAGQSATPVDGKLLAAWRQAQPDSGDADGSTARLLAILDALGDSPGAAWAKVDLAAAPPSSGAPANPALWFALSEAAAAGRVGETVLLALLSLGSDGPELANPIVLNQVIASLRRVDLEKEARALALEAILGSAKRSPP